MKREILPLSELAKLIKDLSKESPYMLKEVLEYAGIPQQYISKWRKGNGAPRRAPYYHELAKVAEKLDKPIEVFIYKDQDPFVHIPKKKYKKLLRAVDNQLQEIDQASKEIKESDLFEYKAPIITHE